MEQSRKNILTLSGSNTTIEPRAMSIAFSVSHSDKDAVIEYIKNQQEHHRKISFRDELRELLVRHGIKFDERYLV